MSTKSNKIDLGCDVRQFGEGVSGGSSPRKQLRSLQRRDSETSYIIQTYIHLARRMTNRRIPQLLGEVLSSMWPTDTPEPGKVVTIKPYFVPVEDNTVAEGDQL